MTRHASCRGGNAFCAVRTYRPTSAGPSRLISGSTNYWRCSTVRAWTAPGVNCLPPWWRRPRPSWSTYGNCSTTTPRNRLARSCFNRAERFKCQHGDQDGGHAVRTRDPMHAVGHAGGAGTGINGTSRVSSRGSNPTLEGVAQPAGCDRQRGRHRCRLHGENHRRCALRASPRITQGGDDGRPGRPVCNGFGYVDFR